MYRDFLDKIKFEKDIVVNKQPVKESNFKKGFVIRKIMRFCFMILMIFLIYQGTIYTAEVVISFLGGVGHINFWEFVKLCKEDWRN